MLETSFMGLKLKNPVIISAGPWNGDGKKLRNNLRAGAGAVITETIVSDPFSKISEQVAYNGQGLQNIRFYSRFQLERWQEELKIAKSDGGIVIASISGHSPSEVTYLAKKLEKYGADAIEISLSSPLGEEVEVPCSDRNFVYDIVKHVVENVKIPVMVKLSQHVNNISEVSKAAKKAGASAISAINTIRCILGVNIEKGVPLLPTYGGYSGAPIRPIGLASVASIAQSVHISICGVGGIENYENVIEYMMLGASTIQIGTALMLNGEGIIGKILNDLEKWFTDKKISSIDEIRGKALKQIKPLDELSLQPMTCKCDDEVCKEDCNLCTEYCLENAIEVINNKIKIDKLKCIGCGLCVHICPINKLQIYDEN
ncbi:4Fe-4S binding protein [Terrisporobacter glycolicus]|uniref:dihydrouracil dehydrogenase (NAD(+)) n=1 Tax=Terrisporobacter glycolicus ATCC 14880 = DSM 1288 TaxID=1121315 RepID=A0ABZ2EUH5_9FIRM|nr:4Fe-4S binding protein [Terrisporobacter glycolicus]